jgi:hypothetical protein
MFEKHGGSSDRLYSIWTNMKTRCYNKNSPKYKVYGARGIIVCEAWKNSYIVFKEWAITHGYSDCLTLDRVDVNGNYEPSNCRWSSVKQQENNRTNNRLITYKGETRTMKQWAEKLGISYNCLQMRLNAYGYTVAEALESSRYKRG